MQVWAALALVAALTIVASSDDFPTSKHNEDTARVIVGVGPQIVPTKTGDVHTLEPTIETTKESTTKQSSQSSPEVAQRRQDTLEYAPGVDQHFSFNNDLTRTYYELLPTKSSPQSSSSISKTSGEANGASRGRSLPPVEPQSTATSTATAPRGDNRKNNPDLREFINDFVKYLNGNGHSRPVMRNRINNRGPPRISDLPPLLLDPPPSLIPPPPPTTHDPPPYPFEKPLDKHVIKPFVSGVPLPEQLVPTETPAVPSLRPPLRPVKPKPTEYNEKTKQENKTKDSTKIFVEPTAITPITQAVTTEAKETTKIPINATKVIGVGVSSTVNVVTVPTEMSTNLTESTESTVTSKTSTATEKQITEVTKPNETSTSSTTTTTIKTTTTPKPSNITIPKNITSSPVLPPTLIESSIVEEIPLKDAHKPTKWEQAPVATKPFKGGSGGYSPRPGIVLDDPEYKPGVKQRPIVTAPVKGEIFDVTVSAIHGAASSTGQPVIYPVELEGVSLPGAGNGEVSVITTAEEGQHFVSIDGKRTYISLFGSGETAGIKPSSTRAEQIKPTAGSYNQRPKRPPSRRPQQPPVRIDTCIVGDWSTCDTDQHEICRTEQGVSSCHCAPGYSRHSHRQPCKRVVSVVASVQVEKIYEHKLVWNEKLKDIDSQEYLQLEYEAVRALESAMSMTPFSDAYMGAKLNNIYTTPGSTLKPVFINMTLQIEESPETLRPQIKQEIQKQLLGAIHRRSNNIGTSALWASPLNSVSHLHDLDECRSPELNDCHIAATCQNLFGSFECTCPPGYKDDFAFNPHKSGRRCETCSTEYCNHRGTCSYNNGQQVCQCAGNYYGSQCEVDGEVLGVAIGASVAAVIIILSTLACLCMWSRRWNREQKMVGIGSPVFGYMPSGGSTVKTPGIGAPPYQVSLEDRLRWAQIADVMAQNTNHYAPEPVGITTRPPSAMFGYGGTLPMAPMPLPRLGLRPGSAHNTRHDSSSEEEDRTDLLGRNFHVPRPKSRGSIANQSGIYYDVDYEQQNDHYTGTKHPGCIALNTYTMGRSHYYRT